MRIHFAFFFFFVHMCACFVSGVTREPYSVTLLFGDTIALLCLAAT